MSRPRARALVAVVAIASVPAPAAVAQPTAASVPERTVLEARLAPVPGDVTWVAHRDVVKFRIDVRNAGIVTADRVRVCVRAGNGAEILSAKGADVTRRRACWTLPSLAEGRSVVRRLTLVSPTRGNEMTVRAVVTPRASQADPVRVISRLPVH